MEAGHQDREEDIKVGVKSAPVLLGDSSKKWMTGFAIACISSLVLSGYNAQIGWAYYVFLIAAFGQLAWQIWSVNLSSAANCKFSTNKLFGAIVFCGILIGRLLPL
ncbi:4-hydroxybenzoate polyprenyltransferase, mitochondrial [Quillaja saponaria]|uniref:4-hydroxybenzoate polyprenyltransferase, mitochondrial n=1 Tax=Quillaja saponaria TaxID=32244 RepID=A0AAD7PN10_QUISA|nr:4-hydroxybenzoate polyprenyltransferase, mitochondrial [Quillaja saponaria]